MTIQAIRGAVESAIQRASDATGVDFGFLLGTAKRESGYNTQARASTSSAGGLFQFVDQTWLATLKQHGAKYGYARYANLIERGSDGRYHVSGDDARKAVMDLKLDAHASSLMAGELASDHAAYLRGRVGRDPTSGELYAAHFLGPQGSARLIEANRSNPAASAASLFPDAASANRAIFYRDGRPATVGEVYANLTRGGSHSVKAGTANSQEFVHYASASRIERLQAQREMVNMVLRGPMDADGGSSAESGLGLGGSMFSTEMLRVLSDARSDHRGRSSS